MLQKLLLPVLLLLLPISSLAATFDDSTALAERDAIYTEDGSTLMEREFTDDDPLSKRCDTCEKPKPKPKPKHKKKAYKGIDFSKQRGHNYVRFILAESITPTCVPVVIDIPNCMDFATAGHPLNDPKTVDSCYNDSPLQTRDMDTDPVGARNCQSFYMENEGGGNYNLSKFHGYPIGVRTANDTTSTIGWDFDKTTSNITWLADYTPDQLSGKFSMDCQTWWEKDSNGVLWHGKNCFVRMVNSDNLCVAADRVNPGSGKPLLYQPCNSKNAAQIWKLQAVALDYPDYGGNCGQACWGQTYGQDPTQLFKSSSSSSNRA